MKSLNKKIVSSVLVGLAVFGGVFQCKGIAAQAAGNISLEERSVSRRKGRDLRLREDIRGYIEVVGRNKYKVVNRFYGSYRSKQVDSLDHFKRIESSLLKGYWMLHIGSVELFIEVLH